jgi:putative transcriptional regulator
VLEAMPTGYGPDNMLITLGYAGWGAGQLENEIAQNAWLTVPLEIDQARELLFKTPVEERFAAACHLLGFDPFMLSGDAGHA